MRSPLLGIMLVLAIAGELQLGWAGEFVGRLERVDLQTITLRGTDNQRFIVQVDRTHRQQAAPYLGMWITVDFITDQGAMRAKGFRCTKSQ
jgi:hypothetical protein